MSQVMPTLIHGAYLASTVLLILGLHNLRSPASAIGGNRLAALGMLVAVLATVFNSAILNLELILLGLIVGALIGSLAARFVQMTAMPKLVGLFNGFGGGASALVAIGEYGRLISTSAAPDLYTMLTILLGMFIGAVTLSGSLVAFGKLQGLVAGAPIMFRFQHVTHGLLMLVFLAGAGLVVQAPDTWGLFLALIGLAFVLGALFVLPIGSADMPVVISLLNACSGLAASATGFIVQNPLLIVAGALVGASGVILTQMMCTSMNRSLAHVLFGTFGTSGCTADTGRAQAEHVVRRVDVEEAAMMLAYARTVVIVPGYGMAVAQAQHAVYELAAQLKGHGVEVTYAIHPVAGRMPGHMNVLLAEANVAYTDLADMEVINPVFAHTDVVLVIGANDIVNPAARSDPQSPIYGMPILDVDKAHHTIVIKRSLNPGFAGIDNPLFYEKNTMMLFGDARTVVNGLSSEVKAL
ncbi:MAG: NAD(P) transhydrogenase subunit beta [Candidatus Entotheonella factor]|uniref:NAD(P) transhydrogenase subunit beta n=1 Tax=Entotheonella factor TaxID=1429438 RepID=W4LHJ8_ENTF1|nr:MAG: NAD(P) transhydrogenase subunit beta [Candidatus Entotheonella factor]